MFKEHIVIMFPITIQFICYQACKRRLIINVNLIYKIVLLENMGVRLLYDNNIKNRVRSEILDGHHIEGSGTEYKILDFYGLGRLILILTSIVHLSADDS